MKRFTVVFIGLILLMATFQAKAESPFIYGIHDHDTNPQEYLDHIRNGGDTGWVTATVAIGSNPSDQGGDGFFQPFQSGAHGQLRAKFRRSAALNNFPGDF